MGVVEAVPSRWCSWMYAVAMSRAKRWKSGCRIEAARPPAFPRTPDLAAALKGCEDRLHNLTGHALLLPLALLSGFTILGHFWVLPSPCCKPQDEVEGPGQALLGIAGQGVLKRDMHGFAPRGALRRHSRSQAQPGGCRRKADRHRGSRSCKMPKGCRF